MFHSDLACLPLLLFEARQSRYKDLKYETNQHEAQTLKGISSRRSELRYFTEALTDRTECFCSKQKHSEMV